jgi:PAS domain S-box-containing protein
MFRSLSLTERLVLNFLLLSVAAILFIGIYSYYSARSAILERTYDHLTSVRISKKAHIENFFNDHLEEITLISRSEDIHRALSEGRLLPGADNKLQSTLDHSLLGLLADESTYEGIYIIDMQGTALKSSFKDHRLRFAPIDSVNSIPILRKLITVRKHIRTARYYDLTTDAARGCGKLLCVAPIILHDSTHIGDIVTVLRQDAINAIMLEVDPEDGLGLSGETYLAGSDYYLKSPSRFNAHTFRVTIAKTPAVTFALAGRSGTQRLLDYRGADVLNSHSPLHVPGIQWVIIAEIDYREAMVPLDHLRNRIALLSAIIAILMFLFIFLLARRIAKPIIHLQKAATQIGKGEFGTIQEIKRKDEIGGLMHAFNEMSLQLKQSTNELRERESRLKHFYDATLDGILLHNEDKPLLVNQAMCKLTGFSERELLDIKVSDIFQQERNTPFKIPLRPFAYETTARKKNGTKFPVEIQVSGIEYGNRMILASVIRDITRRKEVEKELREERLKRLSWVIDGQEIERERFSRELHDGLGQMLVAIKLKLESAIDQEDEKTQSITRDLRMMFDKTIDEVRRISNDLMPSGLQEFGIVNALRKLSSAITENSGISVKLDAQNLPDQLSNKTIMYLYRIAQEAINNSVKHAQASEISISLSCNEKHILLEVKDNGKGFKFDKTHKFVGNGIYNMRERVNMMRGNIEIKSEPTKGTLVKVQIPIEK